MILWPFSPIRYVYELEDTEPPIGRNEIADPFAAKGAFHPGVLTTLESSLRKQKRASGLSSRAGVKTLESPIGDQETPRL
jgi:hypothetical protein